MFSPLSLSLSPPFLSPLPLLCLFLSPPFPSHSPQSASPPWPCPHTLLLHPSLLRLRFPPLLRRAPPPPLHHSAVDSSNLSAALCLLQSQCATSHAHSRPGWIAGLFVNRQKYIGENRSDDDEVCERIKIGAGTMAAAILMQRGVQERDDAVLEVATFDLCLVLTNAVEVQDNSGRTLRIDVFGPTFCWINHGCSPNGCYRFALSSSHKSTPSGDAKLRMAPFTRHSQETEAT